MTLPSEIAVRVAMRNIEELIGLSSSFPQSRYSLQPSPEHEYRYHALWETIDSFLFGLRRNGIPFGNPNPHRGLAQMWGWIWSQGGGAGERIERPRLLYNELLRDLSALADAVSTGSDTPEEMLRELRESHRRTDEIFVIIAFREETALFFDQAIETAAHAVELRAIRIDREEPEGYVTEAILSGIRRALFVVADLTFERPNCYFEAGYAKGAFRRVVFTCRNDHDPRRPGGSGTNKLHFDTDTFRITWWDEGDLEPARRELEDRFRAVRDSVG